MNLQIPANERDENGYVISYLTLRRSVGILGLALPIFLVPSFYFLTENCSYPPSISHYYYTSLGSVFTGTLCAVALFLFCYNGPQDVDKHAATFAAVCALGVAFCPANPYCTSCNTCTRVHLEINFVRNAFHYVSAGLLFITLAYFCLFLFTKKTPNRKVTPEKNTRNVIYRICGITILISIICVPVFSLSAVSNLPVIKDFNCWTFVFEALALIAFGYSWLIKGNTFFKDGGKRIIEKKANAG